MTISQLSIHQNITYDRNQIFSMKLYKHLGPITFIRENDHVQLYCCSNYWLFQFKTSTNVSHYLQQLAHSLNEKIFTPECFRIFQEGESRQLLASRRELKNYSINEKPDLHQFYSILSAILYSVRHHHEGQLSPSISDSLFFIHNNKVKYLAFFQPFILHQKSKPLIKVIQEYLRGLNLINMKKFKPFILRLQKCQTLQQLTQESEYFKKIYDVKINQSVKEGKKQQFVQKHFRDSSVDLKYPAHVLRKSHRKYFLFRSMSSNKLDSKIFSKKNVQYSIDKINDNKRTFSDSSRVSKNRKISTKKNNFSIFPIEKKSFQNKKTVKRKKTHKIVESVSRFFFERQQQISFQKTQMNQRVKSKLELFQKKKQQRKIQFFIPKGMMKQNTSESKSIELQCQNKFYNNNDESKEQITIQSETINHKNKKQTVRQKLIRMSMGEYDQQLKVINYVGECVENAIIDLKKYKDEKLYWHLPMFFLFKQFYLKRIIIIEQLQKKYNELYNQDLHQQLKKLKDENEKIDQSLIKLLKTAKKKGKQFLQKNEYEDKKKLMNMDSFYTNSSKIKSIFSNYVKKIEQIRKNNQDILMHQIDVIDAFFICFNQKQFNLDERNTIQRSSQNPKVKEYLKKRFKQFTKSVKYIF